MGTQVIYITPSAVEDHYIFYYEGKVLKHRIQVAKLLGESRCCEMGQDSRGTGGLVAPGVPAVRRMGKETGTSM